MKKWCILCMLVMCVVLSACAAPHAGQQEDEASVDMVEMPEATPEPLQTDESDTTPMPNALAVGQVTYQPALAPSAFAGSEAFSNELYAMLVGSIRAGSDEVDTAAVQVTDAQFEGVRSFLLLRNPWGTLTDITRDSNGMAKLSYLTQDVTERTDEANKFDGAVSLVLQNMVPEQSTELSASIALYKYVTQTVEQDYDAADGGLYNALVLGTGVDGTYAYAYSFLLDQVGVENTVVLSEDGSHAWNVLTIDGFSFHCDPQVEAGLNKGQALTCFGLSDRDMTLRNGWNTWTSENHTMLSCDNDLLGSVQEAPFADVDTLGNAVYYTLMDEQIGVFRYDLASREVLEVVSAQPAALAVLGEGVYYLDDADNLLYRYRTSDGDVQQVMEGVTLESIRRQGIELHYVQDDELHTENVISID